MEQNVNDNSINNSTNDESEEIIIALSGSTASLNSQPSRQERPNQTTTQTGNTSPETLPELKELANQEDVTVTLKTFNLSTAEVSQSLANETFISHSVNEASNTITLQGSATAIQQALSALYATLNSLNSTATTDTQPGFKLFFAQNGETYSERTFELSSSNNQQQVATEITHHSGTTLFSSLPVIDNIVDSTPSHIEQLQGVKEMTTPDTTQDIFNGNNTASNNTISNIETATDNRTDNPVAIEELTASKLDDSLIEQTPIAPIETPAIPQLLDITTVVTQPTEQPVATVNEEEEALPPVIPSGGAASFSVGVNASNFNQAYTEETTLALDDLVIDTTNANGDTVSVSITLPNAAFGALNTATSTDASGNGAVTSTYNVGTAVWNASGHVDEVNELLANLDFTPAVDIASDMTLNVQITSDGASSSSQFTLTGTNVADAPVINDQALSFGEDSANSTSAGIVTATDADATDTLAYSITAGNGAGIFAINAATGDITIADNSTIDFETTTSYALTVEVTDGALTDDATITLNVTDVNEAPTALTDANGAANNVAEDVTNGAAVGFTASSTDPEASALTYSLLDDAGGRFAINGSTGVVTVADASLLDFETANNHSITVRVTDGSNSLSSNFTINVGDANDAPTDMTLSTGAVDENSAINTAIGTLSTTDQDGGDTHTYSIVSDPDNKFILSGNELRVNGLLNHELNGSHNVTIRSNDGNGGTYDEVFTITINDINDTPIYGNQTFSLAENAANSTTIGTATASDEDGDTQNHSIVNGNGSGIFAVNSATGVITVANNSALDFENDTSHTLEIQADDGNGGTSNAFVTVNVTDENDAPDAANQTFSIAESATLNAAVGTVTSTDQDGDNVSYAITGGNGSGIFGINATTGAITIADPTNLDFESATSHSLTITATDDGTGALTDTATVTVNITDANDAPIVNNQSANLAEDAANSTAIGTVAATDQDSDTLTYAITAGNADGMFAINASTGAITLADNTNLDFEGASSRPLTVSVTDNGTGTLSDTATFTVNITNVNDAPDIANQTLNVLDTANNGDSVGTVTATDQDAGDTLTYAITAGNGAGIFAINAGTGEITVANTGLLSSAPPYALTVSVTDDGTGTLTDTATVNVTVNEVNDAPVINNQTFAVDENNANGSSVATVAATDADGHSLQYSITAGNGDGIFAINATTGEITIASNANLDHEYDDSHDLTVQVAETGTTELYSATATVTVNINDLNEAPIASDATIAINENAINAAFVATVAVTDEDVGQNLSYSILSGNTDNIFGINAANGNITIADNSNLDFESDTQYVLTVQAQDDGTGTLSDTSTITLNINDVNEAPINTLPATATSPEDGQITLTGISVADEDAAELLTITLNVTNGILTLRDDVASGLTAGKITNNGTGTITITGATPTAINTTLAAATGLLYKPDANYAGADTFTMTTNDGALTDVDTQAITVSGVNDAPEEANIISAQGIESSDTWNYTFAANIFSDAEGDTLTYTAQISSDNGVSFTALPAWITFNAGTRTFDVAAPPGAGNEGAYILKILADDSFGGIGESTFGFSVTAAGLGGSGGNDSIPATPGDDVINGGAGNDKIVTLQGNDTIYSGDGNDTIFGDTETAITGDAWDEDLIYAGAGDDWVRGDRYQHGSLTTGGDTIYGEAGNDTIWGYNGADSIDGGTGNDLIYGGSLNDTLRGGTGNDWLYGDTDNDSIDAGSGADNILGGAGNDTLTGGDGADYFRYDSHEESRDTLTFDVITDFEAGVDTIRVAVFTGIIAGAGNASGTLLEWYQTGTGGTAKTIVKSDGVDFNFYLELTGHINLTAGDFEFYGTSGTAGNDTLAGTSGNDAILGNDGDDSITSGDGNDQLYGGNGSDTINGQNQNDVIYGEDGNDSLHGWHGQDLVYGGSGDDTLSAFGTGGTSHLIGGSGNDIFKFDYVNGTRNWYTSSPIIIDDFTKGEDKIRLDGIPLTGFYIGGVNILGSPDDLSAQYLAGQDLTVLRGNYKFGAWDLRIFLQGDHTTGPNALDISDFEFFNVLTDNSANDLDAAANIIRSANNVDEGVYGTSGNDTIYAGETGGAFRVDEVRGGDGDDVIVYNTSHSGGGVNGDKGADMIFVNGLNDDLVYLGGTHDGQADTVIANDQAKLNVNGNLYRGGELFIGGGRGDTIHVHTSQGAQTIYGRQDADNIIAGGSGGLDGNDFIHGGDGNETRIAGGNGNDTLIGGYGRDSLRGGEYNQDTGLGDDTFIFYDIGDSYDNAEDVIFDFNEANDVVELYGYTDIGAGATELTVTHYNATQHGYPAEDWTDISASSSDIDFTVTLRGTINFTVGVNLILNAGTFGTEAAEVINGTAGADYIMANRGNDTINGNDGDDTLFGGGANDSILGGDGDDSLVGGGNPDTLVGGAGADTLEGNTGNDVFKFAATDSTAANTDLIWDFALRESDKIDLSDASFGGITFADLTITTPDIGGGYTTKISHAGTGFVVELLGYYESGFNLHSSDFIF